MSYKNRSRIFARAVKGFAALGLAALIVAGLVGCAQQDTDPNSPQLTDTTDEPDELDLEKIAEYDKENKDFIFSYRGTLSKYDVDTQSEYDSLKFYDIYITSNINNFDSNYCCHLMVRYTCQLDNLEEPSIYLRGYKMDNYVYSHFKQAYTNYDTVETFLDFLYGYKTFFDNKENLMSARLDYEDKKSNGSLTHFTAADFEEYINSLSDPENADAVND